MVGTTMKINELMLLRRRVDTIDRSCHRRRIKHQYFGAPDRCKQTRGLRLSAEVNAGCRRVNVRHDNPHEMAAAGVRNLNSLVGADHPWDQVILQLTHHHAARSGMAARMLNTSKAAMKYP
jgi:hypothetical protein